MMCYWCCSGVWRTTEGPLGGPLSWAPSNQSSHTDTLQPAESALAVPHTSEKQNHLKKKKKSNHLGKKLEWIWCFCLYNVASEHWLWLSYHFFSLCLCLSGTFQCSCIKSTKNIQIISQLNREIVAESRGSGIRPVCLW